MRARGRERSDHAAVRAVRRLEVGRVKPPDAFPDFGDVAKTFRTVDQFAGTDVAVEATGDFARAAWRKLCLNAASGALTALTVRTVEVLCEPGMAELARGIMLECAAVARAEGAELGESVADEILARLRALPAGSGNSMLYDRLAGRPLEIDARNGAIVRIGARHGIATPLNGAVTALLAAQGKEGT